MNTRPTRLASGPSCLWAALLGLAFVVACGGIALIVNWLAGAVFPWLAAQPSASQSGGVVRRRLLRLDWRM